MEGQRECEPVRGGLTGLLDDDRVGRGAGAPGARGAKNERLGAGRGAL